jgi:MFS family permease
LSPRTAQGHIKSLFEKTGGHSHNRGLEMGSAPWLVYVLVALIAFCGGPYRPAHYALMPTLARSVQELVAGNVGTSMFEGVAVLVGPSLAGVLLAVTGPYLVVAVSAAVCFGCAVLVAWMGQEPNWRRARRPHGWTPFREVVEGFRVLAHEPNPRLIVGLIVAQCVHPRPLERAPGHGVDPSGARGRLGSWFP